MPPRILVPFDDSEPAHEALEYAISLFPNGEFVVLRVIDITTMPFIPNNATDAEAHERLEEALTATDDAATANEYFRVPESLAADRDIDLETRTRLGPPAQEIIEFADSESIDHIVLGSRGRSGVARIVLGSVAEVVVRHASVPVTVVR